MKKYFIVLLSAAACQFASAGAVSAQLTLENSYGSLKASLSEIRSGKAGLPQLGRDVIEAPPQSVWPLPIATQWYWHVANAGLDINQAEAAAGNIRSGFVYSPSMQRGARINEAVLWKKKNKPEKLVFGTTAVGTQPFPLELTFDGQLREMRFSYASTQDADKKWLVQLFFDLSSVQFYFVTEAEARGFIDLMTSCTRLAGQQITRQNKYGFRTSDLTPAQADALGKIRIDSALVTDLAYDSPAETAKIAFLDLITEVDGVKVRNAGHFDSILEAAAPGTVLKLSCLERTIVMEGDQKKFVWTPKTVELPVK